MNISEIIQRERKHFHELIKLGKCCAQMESHYVRSLPFHINVISAAARGKLKETAHSIILHDLLHHKSILGSFLENVVGISPDTFCVDNIDYPDHDRIDLSLRSDNAFLIIENKVNYAQEQPGQICRYYELAKSKGYNDSQIIVLYLNPSGYTMPSLYSRTWNGNCDERDYRTVSSDKITVKDFRHDIISWLRVLAYDLSTELGEEPFLQSAICQYLDYLEEKFQTNNRYKKLYDMTEKEIKQELGITDNMSADEQLAILDDRMNQLQNLLTPMEKLADNLKKQKWQMLVKEIERSMQTRFANMASIHIMNCKVPEVGFTVIHNNCRFYVSVVYWTDNKPYWRIFSTSELSDTTKKAIDKLLKDGDFSDYVMGGKEWNFYKTTSDENVELRLTQLVSIFLKSSEFEVVR